MKWIQDENAHDQKIKMQTASSKVELMMGIKLPSGQFKVCQQKVRVSLYRISQVSVKFKELMHLLQVSLEQETALGNANLDSSYSKWLVDHPKKSVDPHSRQQRCMFMYK